MLLVLHQNRNDVIVSVEIQTPSMNLLHKNTYTQILSTQNANYERTH